MKAQLYVNIAAAEANSRLQDFPLSAEVFRDGLDGSEWITDPDAVGPPAR